MVEKRGEEASSSSINKFILKKAVHKRISQIEAKAFISEREIYDFIRSFFKKYLEIDYEFTKEELVKELRRVYISPELQKRVIQLFHDVSTMEHSSRTFSRQELEHILSEFKKLVDELIVSHYQNEKSFFKKLGHSFSRIFSRKHNTMLDSDEKILSENERVIVKMNMLLDNAKRWSNSDVGKAKEAYTELMEIYDTLSESRKKAYFPPVNELYQMIRIKERD